MPDSVAASWETLLRAGNELYGAVALGAEPQRGMLKNLANNRRTEFMFNPVQLKETYGAKYARHAAPGLSHERMQYTGNPNAKIPLTLIFDQNRDRELFLSAPLRSRRPVTGGQADVRTAAQNKVDSVRRQLLEMLYPRQASRLAHASPPQILFVWPGMISMRVRVTRVEFNHLQFQNGTPLPRIMTAQVDLEEDVERRMFMEEQVNFGTIRPWATVNSARRRSRRR